MTPNRRWVRGASGQALVEFVFLLTISVLVCIEIYNLIVWSRDGLAAQGASWFVARSQTFDFRHHNTPEDQVVPLIRAAVFPENQNLEVSLSENIFSTSSGTTRKPLFLPPQDGSKLPIDVGLARIEGPVGNVAPEKKGIFSTLLYAFDLLGVPSLDVSIVRVGRVKVYTRDYFEQLPSTLDLAQNVTVNLNGHRYFQSDASSRVYASWTSAAQNHDFNASEAASLLLSSGNTNNLEKQVKQKQAELYAKAKEYDAQAAADYMQWEAEKDTKKKAKYWQDYLQAKAEAEKLQQEAEQMSWYS